MTVILISSGAYPTLATKAPHILFFMWKTSTANRERRTQCLRALVISLGYEEDTQCGDKAAFITEMAGQKRWVGDISRAILYDLYDESLIPEATCFLCEFMEILWGHRHHLSDPTIVRKYLDVLALTLQYGMCSRSAKIHYPKSYYLSTSVVRTTRVIRCVSLSYGKLATFLLNSYQAR